MLNSTINPALGSDAAAETVLAQSPGGAITTRTGSHPLGYGARCPSEQLATLLADAQAEFDRLHSITRRAGYKIIFRDPSGIIIDHPGAGEKDIPKPQIRGGLAPSALRRLREYVEANLESKVELMDLAVVANLSRCHFAYAFKQSLGCTPHRYVMSRRLEKARQLLVESELPIVEIALATGFVDQSHFSRRFRAFFGISPMAYRRSRR